MSINQIKVIIIVLIILVIPMNYFFLKIDIHDRTQSFIEIFMIFISICMSAFIFIIEKLTNIIEKVKDNDIESKLCQLQTELKRDILLIFFSTILIIMLSFDKTGLLLINSIVISLITANFLAMLDVVLTFFKISEIRFK